MKDDALESILGTFENHKKSSLDGWAIGILVLLWSSDVLGIYQSNMPRKIFPKRFVKWGIITEPSLIIHHFFVKGHGIIISFILAEHIWNLLKNVPSLWYYKRHLCSILRSHTFVLPCKQRKHVLHGA